MCRFSSKGIERFVSTSMACLSPEKVGLQEMGSDSAAPTPAVESPLWHSTPPTTALQMTTESTPTQY